MILISLGLTLSLPLSGPSAANLNPRPVADRIPAALG
jgi:hypothetical protein